MERLEGRRVGRQKKRFIDRMKNKSKQECLVDVTFS